jgi:hypothetical protein
VAEIADGGDMDAAMIADEWGRDPGVRRMRRFFQKMEEAQSGFLKDSSLSLLDERLKDWRREALKSFEDHRGRAARKGIPLSDQDAALLYVTCLSHVIQRSGVKLLSAIRPSDEKISRFLEADPK